MVAISLQRHVGRLAKTPTELKKVFSWLALGPASSNFLGPFVAGLVIDHVGFQAAYGALAVLPRVDWACIRGACNCPPVESIGALRPAFEPEVDKFLADPEQRLYRSRAVRRHAGRHATIARFSLDAQRAQNATA